MILQYDQVILTDHLGLQAGTKLSSTDSLRRVFVQMKQYLSWEHYNIEFLFVLFLQGQAIIILCVSEREKKNFTVKHCRRSSVKFEHLLSCFVEV